MNDDRSRKMRHMFALIRNANITGRRERMHIVRFALCRDVTSCTELSVIELQTVIDVLDHWKRAGELQQRCWDIIEKAR